MVFSRIGLTFFLALSGTALSQELGAGAIITDPAVSARCKRMLETRQSKIETQQRLRALMRRNEKLLDQVPEQKDSVKTRLEFTQTKIQNNIQLSALSLRKLEEDIVRKGCPGIIL